MRSDRARAWTVYDAAGNRLHELRTTARAIRATLPDALIEVDLGRVTITPPGRSITRPIAGESVRDLRGESVDLFDVD